jgi:hypothetical protein
MRRWWLTIAPSPCSTRVVLMSETGWVELGARPPDAAKLPEALQRLSEAMNVWPGPVHAVPAVGDPGAFCSIRRWFAAFDPLRRDLLHKIERARLRLHCRVLRCWSP